MEQVKALDPAALGLAAVLGFADVGHFVRPEFFDEIVPRARPTNEQAAAYGRLPLQIPLVLWALKVRKNASR